MEHIRVYIKPGAKMQKISVQKELDGNQTYVVSVKSLPKEGAANIELIEVISAHFNRPKTDFSIKSGFTSRHKVIVF